MQSRYRDDLQNSKNSLSAELSLQNILISLVPLLETSLKESTDTLKSSHFSDHYKNCIEKVSALLVEHNRYLFTSIPNSKYFELMETKDAEADKKPEFKKEIDILTAHSNALEVFVVNSFDQTKNDGARLLLYYFWAKVALSCFKARDFGTVFALQSALHSVDGLITPRKVDVKDKVEEKIKKKFYLKADRCYLVPSNIIELLDFFNALYTTRSAAALTALSIIDAIPYLGGFKSKFALNNEGAFLHTVDTLSQEKEKQNDKQAQASLMSKIQLINSILSLKMRNSQNYYPKTPLLVPLNVTEQAKSYERPKEVTLDMLDEVNAVFESLEERKSIINIFDRKESFFGITNKAENQMEARIQFESAICELTAYATTTLKTDYISTKSAAAEKSLPLSKGGILKKALINLLQALPYLSSFEDKNKKIDSFFANPSLFAPKDEPITTLDINSDVKALLTKIKDSCDKLRRGYLMLKENRIELEIAYLTYKINKLRNGEINGVLKESLEQLLFMLDGCKTPQEKIDRINSFILDPKPFIPRRLHEQFNQSQFETICLEVFGNLLSFQFEEVKFRMNQIIFDVKTEKEILTALQKLLSELNLITSDLSKITKINDFVKQHKLSSQFNQNNFYEMCLNLFGSLLSKKTISTIEKPSRRISLDLSSLKSSDWINSARVPSPSSSTSSPASSKDSPGSKLHGVYKTSPTSNSSVGSSVSSPCTTPRADRSSARSSNFTFMSDRLISTSLPRDVDKAQPPVQPPIGRQRSNSLNSTSVEDYEQTHGVKFTNNITRKSSAEKEQFTVPVIAAAAAAASEPITRPRSSSKPHLPDSLRRGSIAKFTLQKKANTLRPEKDKKDKKDKSRSKSP